MKKIFLLSIICLALLSAAVCAGAQVKAAAQNIATVKTVSEKAIDNRITVLNNLSKRIAAATRLSDADKASLNSSIQTMIADMGALKTKIDAETDLAAAQADAKSLATEYRVFILFIPKATIMAAADRIQSTAAMMTGVSQKLQARIAQAPAGTDTTALQTAITDMNNKTADAVSQAQAASSEVSGLQPDNGDKTITASNKAALKDARTKLQAARADLAAARKDITIVLKGIQKFPTPTVTP